MCALIDECLHIVSIISLIGIIYYTIWVTLLVFYSIKEPEYSCDFNQIDPEMELYILIPMLNEAGVVQQTLSQFLIQTKNLSAVKLGVIDDSSSDGTGELIQQFISENHCEKKIQLIQRVLPNAQTGKGDSLNQGLNVIRKQITQSEDKVIVGVLDADAVMKTDDFQKVLLQFTQSPQLALLQTKVRMIHAHNWLQKMQDIEFATINDWIQRVRNKIHNAAASGNGQFIRLSAMAGNPTPWGNALLEDFEFSTHFLLANKKTLYRSDIVVYQEAVDKVKPFIRQRSRWCQGGLDCTFKYMIPVLSSPYLGFFAKFEMMFFMLLPFMTLVVGLANFAMVIFAFFHLKTFLKLLLALVGVHFLLAIYTAIKYIGHGNRVNTKMILSCGSLVLYNIILFPAILMAFYRKIRGKQTWIKTTHGVQHAST